MHPTKDDRPQPAHDRARWGAPSPDDTFRRADGGDALYMGTRRIATGRGARLLARILERALSEEKLQFLRREFVREQDLICSALNTGFSTNLARARAALEAHGAPVRIHSEQRGAFRLEVVRPFAMTFDRRIGPSVLIVDGHPLALHGLRKLLEADGGFGLVDGAEDADQAVQCCRRHRYALVVIDPLPSNGNPASTLEPLVRLEPPPRFLVLSEEESVAIARERLGPAEFTFLRKSSAPGEILAGIRRACGLAPISARPIPRAT